MPHPRSKLLKSLPKAKGLGDLYDYKELGGCKP